MYIQIKGRSRGAGSGPPFHPSRKRSHRLLPCDGFSMTVYINYICGADARPVDWVRTSVSWSTATWHSRITSTACLTSASISYPSYPSSDVPLRQICPSLKTNMSVTVAYGIYGMWYRLPLGTEQVVSLIPGSFGYISHVPGAYDYLDPFGFSGYIWLDTKIVLKNKWCTLAGFGYNPHPGRLVLSVTDSWRSVCTGWNLFIFLFISN